MSGPVGTHVISPSVVAPNGLSFLGTTLNNGINLRLSAASNNIVGSLTIGTPGNASYTTPTSLYLDFNNATLLNMVNNTTNITVYSNATLRISGQNSTAYNMAFPKTLTISGHGSQGTNSAWVITGNAGGTYNANVVLAGPSGIDMNSGTSGQTYTLNGTITGTGDLQLVSANTATANEILAITNACTFAGNVTIAGRATLRLTGADNRLPSGAVLTLGVTGGAQTELLDWAGQTGVGQRHPSRESNPGGPGDSQYRLRCGWRPFHHPLDADHQQQL
jgi:hypothetical protein